MTRALREVGAAYALRLHIVMPPYFSASACPSVGSFLDKKVTVFLLSK
jgi:hypothetical protein